MGKENCTSLASGSKPIFTRLHETNPVVAAGRQEVAVVPAEEFHAGLDFAGPAGWDRFG